VGDAIVLTVANRTGHPVRLALAGYEDRVARTLATGATWRLAFLADRPGELAWLIDGVPHGPFTVSGSHLVEGHR
jgi:hypothetical protein